MLPNSIVEGREDKRYEVQLREVWKSNASKVYEAAGTPHDAYRLNMLLDTRTDNIRCLVFCEEEDSRRTMCVSNHFVHPASKIERTGALIASLWVQDYLLEAQKLQGKSYRQVFGPNSPPKPVESCLRLRFRTAADREQFIDAYQANQEAMAKLHEDTKDVWTTLFPTEVPAASSTKETGAPGATNPVRTEAGTKADGPKQAVAVSSAVAETKPKSLPESRAPEPAKVFEAPKVAPAAAPGTGSSSFGWSMPASSTPAPQTNGSWASATKPAAAYGFFGSMSAPSSAPSIFGAVGSTSLFGTKTEEKKEQAKHPVAEAESAIRAAAPQIKAATSAAPSLFSGFGAGGGSTFFGAKPEGTTPSIHAEAKSPAVHFEAKPTLTSTPLTPFAPTVETPAKPNVPTEPVSNPERIFAAPVVKPEASNGWTTPVTTPSKPVDSSTLSAGFGNAFSGLGPAVFSAPNAFGGGFSLASDPTPAKEQNAPAPSVTPKEPMPVLANVMRRLSDSVPGKPTFPDQADEQKVFTFPASPQLKPKPFSPPQRVTPPPAPAEKLSFADRLERFYKKYNPTKVDEVPKLLEKYKGREQEVWTRLKSKYPASADDEEFNGFSLGASSENFDPSTPSRSMATQTPLSNSLAPPQQQQQNMFPMGNLSVSSTPQQQFAPAASTTPSFGVAGGVSFGQPAILQSASLANKLGSSGGVASFGNFSTPSFGGGSFASSGGFGSLASGGKEGGFAGLASQGGTGAFGSTAADKGPSVTFGGGSAFGGNRT